MSTLGKNFLRLAILVGALICIEACLTFFKGWEDFFFCLFALSLIVVLVAWEEGVILSWPARIVSMIALLTLLCLDLLVKFYPRLTSWEVFTLAVPILVMVGAITFIVIDILRENHHKKLRVGFVAGSLTEEEKSCFEQWAARSVAPGGVEWTELSQQEFFHNPPLVELEFFLVRDGRSFINRLEFLKGNPNHQSFRDVRVAAIWDGEIRIHEKNFL